jgi:predicted nucleic-acid-binding protein
MVSVDTSVIVRLLMADDPKQTAAAALLFSKETIWLSKTVVLETAWVLRSMYGQTQLEICALLEGLLGLPNVRPEESATILAMLAMARSGIDLADAIHLASTPAGTDFLSFDKKLVRRAQRLSSTTAKSL